MNIDTFNDRIIKLWNIYKNEKKLALVPLLYSEPPRGGILFITLNPSKPRRNPELYDFNDIDRNRVEEIIKRHKEHVYSEKPHPAFKPFKEIAEYVGFKKQWAQIDLFYYRKTKQHKFLNELIVDKDTKKLNNFACAQLQISVDLIKYIKPVAIVVANAIARDILEGKMGLFSSEMEATDCDEKCGIYRVYHMKIAGTVYPTIYTATDRWHLLNDMLEVKKRIIRDFINKLNL